MIVLSRDAARVGERDGPPRVSEAARLVGQVDLRVAATTRGAERFQDRPEEVDFEAERSFSHLRASFYLGRVIRPILSIERIHHVVPPCQMDHVECFIRYRTVISDELVDRHDSRCDNPDDSATTRCHLTR